MKLRKRDPMKVVKRKPCGKKPIVDLTDQKFGVITVESFAGFAKTYTVWNCVCECGAKFVRRGNSIKHRPSQKCYHIKPHREALKAWKMMMDSQYPICPAWHDFDNFHADMGDPPHDKRTPELLDRSVGFEPGNCVWSHKSVHEAMPYAQLIEWAGEKLTIPEWADRLGITHQGLRQRLDRYPLELAMDKSASRKAHLRKLRLQRKLRAAQVKQLSIQRAKLKLARAKLKDYSLSHELRRERAARMAADVASGRTAYVVAAYYGVTVTTVEKAVKESNDSIYSARTSQRIRA